MLITSRCRLSVLPQGSRIPAYPDILQHTFMLYFGLMIYLHVDPFRERYHLTSCDRKKTVIHKSVSDLTNRQ